MADAKTTAAPGSASASLTQPQPTSTATPTSTTTPTDPSAGATSNSLLLAPDFAMGAIYQSFAHSTGILYENAVQAQQQTNVIAQTATLLGVLSLYAVTPGAKTIAANQGSSTASVTTS